jgi:hypothetical protein
MRLKIVVAVAFVILAAGLAVQPVGALEAVGR